MTLRFLPAVDLERLISAVAGLDWREPLTAHAGPAPATLSRHVWMLPVAGLDGLAAAVQSLTADLDEEQGRPFRGHLTLARARHPKGLKGLPVAPVSVRWPVREIVAFRSELLPGGARHELIGRWVIGKGVTGKGLIGR